MDTKHLNEILQAVRDGTVPVEAAFQQLRDLPYEDLGFAKLDHHRGLRTGAAEVVFCPGKRTDHIVAIMERLAAKNATTGAAVMGTRATPEVAAAVRARLPQAEYYDLARIIVVRGKEVAPPAGAPSAAVLCAGTADLPVAEEAAVTLEILGDPVDRISDVGVAGLHRLLDHLDRIRAAKALIVVAGMEGALPSVLGGLVDRPIIAVPTSTGYGASFGGLAALLAMLNSCAPGVGVVNIDNGFGAARLAHLILAGAARE